jgi:hypothetical protein
MPKGNCPHFHLRKETDQVFETLWSFRIPDYGHSPDKTKSRIFKNVPEKLKEYLGREFLLEIIIIAVLIPNSLHFIEPEGLLPYSEDPVAGIYTEPHEHKKINKYTDNANMGRAIAQAVSRWLPTAAVRVRSRVWSSGICGGQSGARASSLRVLRFLLPIFIPAVTPQSPSPIIWG